MVITAPLCKCGCRNLTGWSTRAYGHLGYRKGDPVRFCRGHGRAYDGVETAVMCERFEASGVSARTVALRLAWIDSRGYPDGPRVRRALGMRPEWDGTYRRRMTQAVALRIGEALGLDPVDIGL